MPWTSIPHSKFKLMSTTVLFNFKAVTKAWPWNAFRVQSWCQEYCRSLNSKGLTSKYLEYIEVSKNRFWPTHQMCLNVFKHHLRHLHISTHCFWDGLKKPLQNHHEENQSVGPWCLWHRCRSFADSDAWSFDLSSTSLQTPGRMQLCKAALRFHKRLTPQHLHTLDKSTTPRPLHHRIVNCPSTPNWCQRRFCCTSRLWPRPGRHEMHSEQSTFDACWKK